LKPESWAVHDAAELEESQSGDEFHDAEQGSDNLEQLETLSEQKNFEELDGVDSDAEPAPEDGSKSGTTVLPSVEPQLASTVEEPQNVFGGESLPSAQSSESAEKGAIERDGDIAAEDSPLTSSVEEPLETVKEPVTAAISIVELPETVQAGDGAGKSPDVLSSSEPQLVEEPQEALAKELSVAEASEKLGEPATQEKPEDMPVKEPLPEPVKGDDGGKSPAELSFLEPSIAYETSAKRGEPAAQENGDAGKWYLVVQFIYVRW
jgi:hypothetical protein